MDIKRIILTLFFTMFAVNCSIEQPDKDKLAPKKAPVDEETKEIASKDNSDRTYSQLIEREADLPECDSAHERQLVYVVETSQFKSCSKAEWKVVDIKGKNGSNGKDGKDGTNGKDGQSGTDGVTGKDGQVVNGNMWYDPIAKKYWLIPSIASATANPTICTSGWRFPTSAEVALAAERGLRTAADAVNAPARAYISTPTPNYYVSQHVRSSGTTDGNYCIQE